MTVLYSVEGAIATITLNRPDARNALNDAMCEDLRRIVSGVDPSIRLVFVRGKGPVFCAGADVKERAGMSTDQVRARRLKAFAAYHALESLPMPSVAVVHGAALGSGVEIAAACDFIISVISPAVRFFAVRTGRFAMRVTLPSPGDRQKSR